MVECRVRLVSHAVYDPDDNWAPAVIRYAALSFDRAFQNSLIVRLAERGGRLIETHRVEVPHNVIDLGLAIYRPFGASVGYHLVTTAIRRIIEPWAPVFGHEFVVSGLKAGAGLAIIGDAADGSFVPSNPKVDQVFSRLYPNSEIEAAEHTFFSGLFPDWAVDWDTRSIQSAAILELAYDAARGVSGVARLYSGQFAIIVQAVGWRGRLKAMADPDGGMTGEMEIEVPPAETAVQRRLVYDSDDVMVEKGGFLRLIPHGR
jgi:hypothetical protein